MKLFLLINVKMPTIVGILTFMSEKNSILGLSECKKAECLDIFMLNSVEHEKSFITLGPDKNTSYCMLKNYFNTAHYKPFLDVMSCHGSY